MFPWPAGLWPVHARVNTGVYVTVQPDTPSTCGTCGRAVYARDLNNRGLCVLCVPPAPATKPTPVVKTPPVAGTTDA